MTSWPSKQANCFALEPLSSSAKNSAPDEVHVPALEATLLLQEVQDMLRDAPSSSILFTFSHVSPIFPRLFARVSATPRPIASAEAVGTQPAPQAARSQVLRRDGRLTVAPSCLSGRDVSS